MFHWSDTDGPATENELVYDFSSLCVYDQSGTGPPSTTPSAGGTMSTLTDYLQDDKLIGVGFDPDCHFFNSGVVFQITTEPSPATVPIPVAAIPFTLGMLAAVRGRRC